ncbi:MAG: tripartite tricarboxylate transporter permease [Candidatus ainarchaeum sp.]|nr:tripartite tricarboxylate transporter permease [Candidatus ainarchaeum sp.]MDD3975888.1 tripartite tricarboxylate transporter permease [Candidatus ainarchaeum sp.]
MIYFLQIIVGVLLGTFIGFFPNIHINLLAYVFSIINLIYSPDSFYFFLSFSISQLISSYLPTTFFGIPNESTVLSLFPSQRLNLKGESKLAIYLCLFGSFLGCLFSILILPFLGIIFSLLKDFNFIIYFSIILSLFLFILSQSKIKDMLIVFSIIIFSGSLGIFTLKYNLFFREPLFVCITCLFAFPYLISSIFNKHRGVFQSFSKVNLDYNKYILPGLIGSISSFLIILIPSFSSSQAAAIISSIKKKINEKVYLIIFSSISISALIFSYFLAINFNKPRLGYIAILLSANVLPVSFNYFIFSIVILISSLLSSFIIFSLINFILKIINHLNLYRINIFFFIFILFILIFVSGFNSIFLIIISTLIGFIPLRFNKSRLFLISYLMIPTLLFYI